MKEKETKFLKVMVNNKLPRCFSIPDEDLSPKRKMSTKKDLNSTLDATFRKIHSEQVSPRTQPKIANSKAISIKSNNDEKLKNWNR